MRLSNHSSWVVVALALSACQIGSKVGDLEGTETAGDDTGDQAPTTSTTTTLGATESIGEPGTTSTTTTAADTSGNSDSMADPGTTSSTTTGALGESGESDASGEPGTTSSTTTGVVMDCLGLAEGVCAATPGCREISGHEHVLKNGGACVDEDVFVFLACDVDGGACPPFIPTVCPVGETKPQFDVPSGCIPPGFESCDGVGGQPCK